MNKIKFLNLKAQYDSIKSEIDEAISRVIDASSFIRGPEVELFEKNFAVTANVKYCLSCANGTDALYIAMKALGVRGDDEVIVPAMSWISTSETVTQSGGKVVFCDVNPKTYTIDIADLKSKINRKTVGVIAVHLYGHPADMESIQSITKEKKLWLIEDCAQAHFAKINNRLIGTYGDAATFSFYPSKNLGAMGDAGAIVTNKHDLYLAMTKFARHGGLQKGEHEIEGINSRMDGIQAAVLNVKLKKIHEWSKKREDIANTYNKLITNKEIKKPETEFNYSHAWHLYVIKHKKRNLLKKYLNNKGIETSINYPVSLPFLPCYKNRQHKKNDFPNAYDLQENCLCLPLYPELKQSEVEWIVKSINEYISESK